MRTLGQILLVLTLSLVMLVTPSPLAAQTGITGTSGTLVTLLLASGLAVLVYDGVKTLLPGYDHLPGWAHRILQPALALVFGMLAIGLGPKLGAIINLNPAWVHGVLTVLASAGIWRLVKRAGHKSS